MVRHRSACRRAMLPRAKSNPATSQVISAVLSANVSGTETITVTATDEAGNTTSISEPVLVDLSVPSVTTTLADGARLGPQPADALPVTIQVVDVEATAVTFSTGAVFSLPRGGGEIETSVPLNEGTSSFVVTVQNESGRVAQLLRTVVYDKTPPVGSIESPPTARSPAGPSTCRPSPTLLVLPEHPPARGFGLHGAPGGPQGRAQ